MICIACAPHFNSIVDIIDRVKGSTRLLMVIPVVIACSSAVLAGWLSDMKFGNYRVFKAGVILLFIYNVLNCFLSVVEVLFWEDKYTKLNWLYFSLGSSLLAVSVCTVIVTALPLGLDQMPDASASSITSFIAWFVFCLFIGSWFTSLLNILKTKCIMQTYYSLLVNLLSTLCTSIPLISTFLLNPKWLLIESESPQSLRIIYGVLKFAAKHKTPLYQGASPDWFEDTPSRIDFGKSKYGVPFTTEQVENVKTIFRLLVISFSLSFIVYSLSFHTDIQSAPTNRFLNLTLCTTNTVYLFTYNASWCGILGFLVYEFIIHPLARNKLPSILRRIGTVSLMVTLVTFVCFILKLAHYLSTNSGVDTTVLWIARILYHVTFGLFSQAILTLVLEFVCAQSPYTMRGLFLSVSTPLVLLTIAVDYIVNHYAFYYASQKPWHSPVVFSIKTVVCLIGFLLFCVVARRYKRRVKEDDYSPRQAVEEVYT